MVEPEVVLDSVDVPLGRVLTDPFRVEIDNDYVGSALLRFTMATRHFSSQVPLNERISHHLNMEWLVVSAGTGRTLGVIAQSDHSYRHPELTVNLPEDRSLIFVPNGPYFCDHAPAATVDVVPLGLGPAMYRYEFEVGSASDSGFVSGHWSYREGHLAFEHWFHNKAFRWGFDGASLRLPAVPGASMWVAVNALCRTEIEVWANGVHLTTLGTISGSSRWHDEAYGFVIPSEVVTGDDVELIFRFRKPNAWLIDFNLRQSAFALSRVIVDLFGQDRGDLPRRIAERAWCDPAPRALSLASQLFDRDDQLETQAALLISSLEFELVQRYFAPHSHFWNVVRGAMSGFLAKGVSMKIAPAEAGDASGRFETRILGPLRFDPRDGRRMVGDPSVNAAIVSLSIPSLIALDLPLDDELLAAFSYREVFGVDLPDGRKGNFWEFSVTQPGFWSEEHLGWGGTTFIGRSTRSPWTLLASASPQEWMEMGDPSSLQVLRSFVDLVCASGFLTAGGRPCVAAVEAGELLVVAPEHRTGLRSSGGGIARGWPTYEIDGALFAEESHPIILRSHALPRHGAVSIALQRVRDEVEQGVVTLGKTSRFGSKSPAA